MSDVTEVLANIQGLARTIRRETGLYVSYSEDMHPSATAATVSIQHQGDDGCWHEWFKGCETPSRSEVTLEAMRDELCEYLTKARKAKEAA